MLAILAGGVVLGVGTAITLAVWNDSEFATGSFAAGQFDLEGSIDGTAFTSSPTAPGKTLTFELDADMLSPDSVVYESFAVQLSSTSDYEAAVTITNSAASTTGDIGADLTYSLYSVSSFGATCSAASPPTGTALVSNRAVTATGSVAAFDLTAAAAPTYLCFVVTAGTGLSQGEAGTVTWEFVGTSGAALP